MSNLVEHARRELEIIREAPEVIDQYVKMIKMFADMDHSGGSSSVFIPTLNELLKFKPLSPLTDNPDEWVHHTEEVWPEPGGVWQNVRDGEAFSNDGGKTYYLIGERDAAGLEFTPIHTSKEKKWEF